MLARRLALLASLLVATARRRPAGRQLRSQSLSTDTRAAEPAALAGAGAGGIALHARAPKKAAPKGHARKQPLWWLFVAQFIVLAALCCRARCCVTNKAPFDYGDEASAEEARASCVPVARAEKYGAMDATEAVAEARELVSSTLATHIR
ncbi:hypothetical protein M885DRAFT_580749 [Pelagophyceae sp. CCMP2097]|nr:hypothetical protein M885DRAFT_580749 [Pelagophyceae sp. CCMP2097]